MSVNANTVPKVMMMANGDDDESPSSSSLPTTIPPGTTCGEVATMVASSLTAESIHF